MVQLINKRPDRDGALGVFSDADRDAVRAPSDRLLQLLSSFEGMRVSQYTKPRAPRNSLEMAQRGSLDMGAIKESDDSFGSKGGSSFKREPKPTGSVDV